MKEMENSKELDFEAELTQRMETLVARKRAENEMAIARVTALDTAWQEVHMDLDKDLKAELETVRLEAQAIEQARERLKRNPCAGVDKSAYAIAGKVVDVESKIGLPGLMVKVTLALQGAEQSLEAKTDSYGNFFLQFPLTQSALANVKHVSLLFVVLLDADTVVHREQKSVEPKAGGIEHVTIAVKCSGRLKDALDYGKQVAESVEGDAELVERRSANLDETYTAFGRLSDTALLHLRRFKEELSVTPPTCSPASKGSTAEAEPAPSTKTRYLGNSATRELHDMNNITKRCQIDGIKTEHRVAFKIEKDAEASGYDYCAYCFGKRRSRR